MNFYHAHPFGCAIGAFLLVSNFVDALRMCPPKATDGRLYLFAYTFLMGIAGNTTTLLSHLTGYSKNAS
jgi:hypothetical protein